MPLPSISRMCASVFFFPLKTWGLLNTKISPKKIPVLKSQVSVPKKKRSNKPFVRPTLLMQEFLCYWIRKSDFPQAKNPTTSVFDVLSYDSFGFMSWGNQEKHSRTQTLNSTTRTSDLCRVGRSIFTSSSKKGNGMWNPLGSCFRAFLLNSR